MVCNSFCAHECEMCVNHFEMVPAVVNFVTNKGKESYNEFLSDLMCLKCKTLSVSVKTKKETLRSIFIQPKLSFCWKHVVHL